MSTSPRLVASLLFLVWFAGAAHAQASPAPSLEEITAKGAMAPREQRAKFEHKFARLVQNVDTDIAIQGPALVAARLANEFNADAEFLIREEARHGCGWAVMVTAYTLASNGKLGVTPEQILHLRDARLGWGQIASGMGLRHEDVIRAVKTEIGVARGTEQPDGKVAIVRGEGSIHDGGDAAAGSRPATGTSTAGASATVKAGASDAAPGVKVGH